MNNRRIGKANPSKLAVIGRQCGTGRNRELLVRKSKTEVYERKREILEVVEPDSIIKDIIKVVRFEVCPPFLYVPDGR
ncbi:hypothetical protein IEQ34_022354 [Dendrobium chrysotoxum]|uniref:Uncharacterized protein n=1 Tax=Dendrobium chrysotoxum TaxID=161865 RepID=A0AAV7FXI6_DENCH|nr:hypothetical protein IEQ34_022354 [Dendrobium chrysotoxum]